jgi:hypothetical protein
VPEVWQSRAMADEVFPVTIVRARYGGIYEPGRWLAFPRDPDQLPVEWQDEGLPCRDFWLAWSEPVGGGDTPNDAYSDLVCKVE